MHGQQLAIAVACRRAPRESEAADPMSTKCDSGGGDVPASWPLHRTFDIVAAATIPLSAAGATAGSHTALVRVACQARHPS